VSNDVIILATVLLLVFVAVLLLFVGRVRAGHRPNLRRIQAFDALKGLTGRSVETGRPLHLSLGIGGITDKTTADSLAGLSVLDHLSQQAAVTGAHPLVTMADPALMLFAQNRMRAAQGDNAQGAEDAARHVRWIAPQPAAYAAGVMSLFSVDDVESNVMVGKFGDEYLLMGEAATQQDISHIGGTSDPNTLPFVYTSAQETLLGEEIYAAGAYLQKSPAHIGSLLAQDTMRWVVAIAIGVGVLLTTLGLM